ncbi:MAG TPA: hypothetical protein EYP04_13665 [Anaerolineae bacterium]|nr:hypothetical protein [Anaerolineae bacterium]HIQ05837.1 hypothetical protein [Anaerolineae bacterium]
MDREREGKTALAVPLIRWLGWRPPYLDLNRTQRGGQVLLVLEREGDLVLLPCVQIGYIYYAPEGPDGQDECWQRAGGWPVLEVMHASGAFRDVVRSTVSELEAEGWQLIGRLHAMFTGIETETDFWAAVDAVTRVTARQEVKEG